VSVPHLRPLGVGEILDVGMKIAWRNAGTLVRAVVVVVLPVQVLSTIILISSLPDDVQLDSSTSFDPTVEPGATLSVSDVAAFAAGAGASVLLSFLAGLLAAGACYRAIASAYLGERTGWRDSLRFAGRRVHSIIWVTILAAFVSLLGAIACILPGVYLWVAFSVAVPVLMTEGARGRRALGRSRRLVSGFWWRAFAIVLLGGILTGILGAAIGALAAGITSVGSGSSTLVFGVQEVFTGTVSDVLTTPLTAAFTTILYFDLRVRKEAFDLQLLADRLSVEPPTGYEPPPEPPTATPPYWPPPPGWQPPAEAPPDPAAGDAPPFWPPPPGWKPRGE